MIVKREHRFWARRTLLSPDLPAGIPLDSLSQSREKANVLDFEIVDEKEKRKERKIGKEVQMGAEGRIPEVPSREREDGKEEGRRPPERDRGM